MFLFLHSLFDFVFFFFFSSRRRHTRSDRDWSSDVCSSDLRVHDEKTLTMLDRRGSRRTESLWLRTTVFAKDGLPVAKMLLNLASLKDSYAPYAQEYDQLYAQGA